MAIHEPLPAPNATDSYGPPCSIVETIDLAGQVEDLSAIDTNYPYFCGDFTKEQLKTAFGWRRQ